MFIKIGDKRINISVIKEYLPVNKPSLIGKSYSVELYFIDNTKREIYFYNNEDERNNFLKSLDDILLNRS